MEYEQVKTRILMIAVALMIVAVTCIGCASKSVFGTGSSAVGATSLFIMPEGVETRWASAENWKGEKGIAGQANGGRKGSPRFTLKAGEKKILAEVTGRSGVVRRIWATINDRSPEMLRGVRFCIYWDGADEPAVSAPIGDFFCHGLGRMTTFQSALFSSPEGRSFNCCVPMPFKTGMKVVVTNQTDKDLTAFYYDIDYTLGDKLGDNVLYFHAHYRRENPTRLQEDYQLLPRVVGCGRFLGVNIGVIADQQRYFKSWWGEGEVKIYLDGDDKFPTLCGTGTEDYIGTGWGQGRYANLYQGCHLADKENMQYCFYRFHIPDPVYFRKDIRVTMQQIGYGGANIKPLLRETGQRIYRAGPGLVEIDLSEPGKQTGIGLFERQDDWSSCAYFYLDKPVNNLGRAWSLRDGSPAP